MKHLIVVTMVFIVGIMSGCKKEVSPKPQESTPQLFLSIANLDPERKDTVWFRDSATISFTSLNASTITIEGITMPGTSGTFKTGALTTKTIITGSVTGKGGTASTSISIPVYSQRMTMFCKNKSWKMTDIISVAIDSLAYPQAYRHIPVFDGDYNYRPNGKGTVTTYSGAAPGTFTMNDHWYFYSNEDSLHWGYQNDWKILSLTDSTYCQIQDKPSIDLGTGLPTTQIWRAFIYWRKV